MTSLEDLFKQKAEDSGNCQKLCSEYIGGEWKNLQENEFDCKIIPGGLCNRVFVCTNKKLIDKGTMKMPEKVLVRTYGSDFVGKRGDMIRVADSALPIIQQILYSEGLGPKIFGVFDGGRVEEYIEHEEIDPNERSEMKYLQPIMRRIAAVHSLEVPISKEPFGVLQMVKQWYQDGQQSNSFLFTPGSVKPELEEYRVELTSFNWSAEIDWFEKTLPLVDSRSVFNHNDIQYANIFLRKSGSSMDEKIFLFDYENCSYGFRGYDIAFFIYAKSVDFFAPRYWEKIFWPEDDVVRKLVSIYRDEHIKGLASVDPVRDSLDHLCMEVDFFLLLVLLLRNCVAYKKINENFQDVLNFSHNELARYFERKTILMEKYKNLTEERKMVEDNQ